MGEKLAIVCFPALRGLLLTILLGWSRTSRFVFLGEGEEQGPPMISTPNIRLEVYAGFLLFGVPLVAVLLCHGDGISMACPALAHLCFQAETAQCQPQSWPDFICILESWLVPPLSIIPCSPLCPLHHQ